MKVTKRGAVVRIKKDGQSRTVHESGEQPMAELPGAPSSVGLSLTIGVATEFVREKVEVSSWCTIATENDSVSRALAYEECRATVEQEVKTLLDDAIDKFFPDTFTKGAGT